MKWMTFSSLCSTIFFGALLIGILQKIFKHPKIYGYIPISMLFVIVFTILLRFFLPIEFFYTISVWIPFIMNPLNSFVNYSLYGNFQILDLIIIIGVLGMFFPLKGYIKQILHSKRVYSFLVHSAEEKELNDFLNTEMLKIPNYSVYITDKIESPMGIQNHKAIFLPSSIYSNEELEVILLHEIAHIQQKDIYLKHLVNWLLILYWWFPWIKKFQRNVNLFLELKADEYAVNHSTTRNRLFYAKTLLSVKKQIKEKKKIKIAANYLISDSSRLLSTRIEYLAKQPQRKKVQLLYFIL